MEKEEFRKYIEKECKENNIINLQEFEIDKLYTYMREILKWNEKVNLTAIKEEKEFIVKHFIDSLSIASYIPDTAKVIDIGTGAGFPGIPLKILKKDLSITLLDSLNKRITFLEEVIRNLSLENIQAVHARAEELAHKEEYREQYDIAVSRAVAPMHTLLEYMLPLTKVGGKCICLKGPNIEKELEEAKNAIEILGAQIDKIEEIKLPDSDNKRNIIVIKSVKQLPNKYPRKAGTPTVSPL